MVTGRKKYRVPHTMSTTGTAQRKNIYQTKPISSISPGDSFQLASTSYIEKQDLTSDSEKPSDNSLPSAVPEAPIALDTIIEKLEAIPDSPERCEGGEYYDYAVTKA